MSDAEACALISGLDAEVAALEGHGFRETPFGREEALSEALGFSAEGGVWVKDETGNVSGSHKARHLFEVALQLEVAERLGYADPTRRATLAIASCGNAALAAAVVAAACGRALEVFVPRDADPIVLHRLEELGARISVCGRDGSSGDPTYHRLLEALAAGALPFTCQGNLNGLAVEGGMTLGYELVSELARSGERIDRLIVQVGGGALASACFEALADARALGAIAELPRIDTVQTEGAWPLRRAYEALLADRNGFEPAALVRRAAGRRARYMWAWESEPQSIAHGILDDETYDWLAVCEAMLVSGGTPLVVDEPTLAVARTPSPSRRPASTVDATGSAGLAGLLAARMAGAVGDDERVALLFTGLARTAPSDLNERIRDEELPRQRHPVAQGL